MDGKVVNETDEFQKTLIQSNEKRTHDVHQSEDQESFRRNRLHFDNTITLLQTHMANLNTLTTQAINNSNESARQATTQARRLVELGTDHQWNPIQQGVADAHTVKASDLSDVARKLADLSAVVANMLGQMNAVSGRPVTNPTGTEPK